MPEQRRPFTKPALSVEEQIDLLSSRGLNIQDHARTLHYLQYIGYYRLSGYFRPFQKPHDLDHTFLPGTTFGTLSRMFQHLKSRTAQKKINSHFRVHYTVLTSWLHSLTALRNICAHHERLWNRILPFSPKKLKGYEAQFGDDKRFCARAAVINTLLKVIADGSTWQQRLWELLSAYPQVKQYKMGFPAIWHNNPFWGIEE